MGENPWGFESPSRYPEARLLGELPSNGRLPSRGFESTLLPTGWGYSAAVGRFGAIDRRWKGSSPPPGTRLPFGKVEVLQAELPTYNPGRCNLADSASFLVLADLRPTYGPDVRQNVVREPME